MRPVQTADTTLVLTGPDGVGDLYAQRLSDGSIASVWWLTPDERAAVAAGANVALIVAGPHPVVMLAVVDVEGSGEDRPEILERADQLRRAGA
jgi:hypothetical protein